MPNPPVTKGTLNKSLKGGTFHIMTVAEIERAIQQLDLSEIKALFLWIEQQVKERQEAETLPDVDEATFKETSQRILREHGPLLKKLAE